MIAHNTSSSSFEFFVAGGTLPASAPSYVSRPADEQLFEAAAASRFCYVLTTRQMGKSSLMVRTARRLKQQGVCTAIIDLTTMGGKTEETWYLDFLTELSDQLDVQQDVEAWWQERGALGPVRRFSNFLRDVVLEEINSQIVIFVDEIDFTLGLPFADDFFAAVRATYNARALDAKFNRLTFIFLGVAAPADLIKDRTRTPFNIGEGIVLRDLDRSDAVVLQQGLEAAYSGQGQLILDRIFYWTSGHPYLTQKLCHEVVEAKHLGPWSEAEVDRVVNDLFLSNQMNREQNLQFVQDRVLKNPQRRDLLKLYGKVRAGKPIANDEQSVLQNQLKLAGLVITDNGTLHVHNEIYYTVFDAKWIKANTPRDNNRVAAFAAIALAVLVVVLAGFVLLRNSYVQRESDQLQLEFTQVESSAERFDRLAQLFELQGILNAANYDDAARRLFFDMNSRQDQLALFKVQDPRLVSVIEGLYSALADVNKSGENDELLTAMRDALQAQQSSAEATRLYTEIDYWLKARAYTRQDQYNDALEAYGKAIQNNSDDSNPATHFERARVMLDLPSPIYPQALSDLDAVLAAASKVSEAQTGEAEAEATSTPTPTEPPLSTAMSSGTQTTPAALPAATVMQTPAVPTTKVAPALSATVEGRTPVPVPTRPGSAPLPPEPGQRPFRSQFITFVQIASAVKRLIDSNQGLVKFLANCNGCDYGNLREANLVRTLTPTPMSVLVSTPVPQVAARPNPKEAPPPALPVPVQLGSPLTGHDQPVNSVAFSPDGKTLASGSDDNTIILWDVSNPGSPVQLGAPLDGHSGRVGSVAFSPDGKTLASGSADNTIILWDVETRQPVGEPLTGHSDTVTSVAFSPDGRILASGSDDNTVILWNVATHQPLGNPLTEHTGNVKSVAFSPDGRILASGSDDNTIILWDVASRQQVAMFNYTDGVTSVAFSPDGKFLASGSYDKNVLLWDVESGQQVGQLTGHTDGVTSVTFSLDGRVLSSGSFDNTIISWDVSNPQTPVQVGEPLGSHTNSVLSLAFSPDGRLLASGSADDTVILWDLTGGSLQSGLTSTGATPAANTAVVTELLRRTNELRTSNKLSPYTLNADLNRVAQAHSQDMANHDQLTHVGSDGSTPTQRITAAGYGAGQPAENIYGGQGATVEDAWAFWTTDPPHLANLLNSVNTDIGMSVIEGKTNTYYTVVFGKSASAATPALVQSLSTPNGLNGQVVVAGNTGSPELPEFQDQLSFELVVFDPDTGKTNGAGVTSVEMSVIDPAGRTIFRRTEQTARYCAFGGGEPDCTVWNFGEHGNAWPDGTPVCAGSGYQALMGVKTTDTQKDGAHWDFAFSIAGKYPACQALQ